jgi:hypothetical protein
MDASHRLFAHALRISGKLNARFGEVEQAMMEVLRSA